MKHLLKNAFSVIDDGAAELFPGYFAVVMATGASSISSHLMAYEKVGLLLLFLNLLAYAVLSSLILIRLVRYPRRLMADMTDHARSPGFFTLVAGTCILGSQCQILLGWQWLAVICWWLGLGLWVVIMYLFFIVVTTREQKPDPDSGLNGTWLLTAVSTQSVAILTVLIPWSGPQELRLLFALCMFMVGCMLYLSIITLIFYRLIFLQITAKDLTPPYWINMGAVAIATLAGSILINKGMEDGEVLVDFLPFLRGFTLFFWATASWWIPLLIGLMVWRHIVQQHRIRYEPQLWSMVFPLAMYTTGTLQLIAALDIPFLMFVPKVTIWFAWAAWVVTSAAMFWHFGQRFRIACDRAESFQK